MKEVSINQMNKVIAEWLYGEGKMCKDDSGNFFWESSIYRDLQPNVDFDKDNNLLIQALTKIMLSENKFWYAVYPLQKGEWKGKGENKKFVYTNKFYCAFTENGNSRIGYGNKLNDKFEKETPELSMHYSIYRLIKNGLEY